MEIEAALPDKFEELSREKKIEELESLKQQFDSETDAGAIKTRMIEELIRKYRSDE